MILPTFILVSLISSLSARVDDGVPCPNVCREAPMDISFIVDSSSSISRSAFQEGLWFVQDIVRNFNIGPQETRVSMVTFGNRTYSEQAFSFDRYTNKVDLDSAIINIRHMAGSRTETGDAINWFLANQENQRRPGIRHILIVLTDGESTRPSRTDEAAEKAHAEGLEIFAVGVGPNVNNEELQKIASGGGSVFLVSEYSALDDITTRLVYKACRIVPEPKCRYEPVDLSIVIDTSVSIGESNFLLQLQFIKEFVEVFEFNPSSARLAAIMFGYGVYNDSAINFNSYKTKPELLHAILNLEWKKATRTDTGDGIMYMVRNFVPEYRPYAAHIGIVITDGESQRRSKTQMAAKEARKAGVTMVAVGIGSPNRNLNPDELEGIAGSPDRVVIAENFKNLNTIREQLLSVACEGIADELQERAGVYNFKGQ